MRYICYDLAVINLLAKLRHTWNADEGWKRQVKGSNAKNLELKGGVGFIGQIFLKVIF